MLSDTYKRAFIFYAVFKLCCEPTTPVLEKLWDDVFPTFDLTGC